MGWKRWKVAGIVFPSLSRFPSFFPRLSPPSLSLVFPPFSLVSLFHSFSLASLAFSLSLVFPSFSRSLLSLLISLFFVTLSLYYYSHSIYTNCLSYPLLSLSIVIQYVLLVSNSASILSTFCLWNFNCLFWILSLSDLFLSIFLKYPCLSCRIDYIFNIQRFVISYSS